MGEVVKVFRAWRSPVSWRVELALKLKGIEYEIMDEDLSNKSDELLQYNPIHKKVPVLVHNGKPIAESLVILEYIDETWNDNYPLLPTDPYERSHARFWAKFIDDKVFSTGPKAIFNKGGDVEKEKAKEEFCEVLKMFEKEMEGKMFLGGSKIGYLDIVGLFVAYWIPVLQEAVGNEILTRQGFPGIYDWIDRVLAHNIMKENLPNRGDYVASYKARLAASP